MQLKQAQLSTWRSIQVERLGGQKFRATPWRFLATSFVGFISAETLGSTKDQNASWELRASTFALRPNVHRERSPLGRFCCNSWLPLLSRIDTTTPPSIDARPRQLRLSSCLPLQNQLIVAIFNRSPIGSEDIATNLASCY